MRMVVEMGAGLKLVWLCLIMLSWLKVPAGGLHPDGGSSGPPPRPMVVTAHESVTLNCTAPARGNHVVWFRPGDGLQVSHDTAIIPELRARLRITGDHHRGEYNLQVRYAAFPADNGTWRCSVYGGEPSAWDLTVLVPPARRQPSVNPPIGIIYQLSAEAWTFSCVAHPAYPPVKLTWVRKSGPPSVTEYDAAPARGIQAPDMTVSSSVNLILTAHNHGSVFACLAEHPTYAGHIYSTDVHFMIADPKLANGIPAPVRLPTRAFSAGKVGIILVFAFVFLVVIIMMTVMCKLRHRWTLDVRPLPHSYDCPAGGEVVETSMDTLPMEYNKPESEDGLDTPPSPRRKDSDSLVDGHRPNGRVPTPSGTATDTSCDNTFVKERRRCIVRFLVGAVLTAVLLIAVGLIIPIYINGFPMPVRGVDAIVPVVAGSLLWLDCGELAMANDNLLQIGWRQNFNKFYNQYPNTHPLMPPIGQPTNFTTEKFPLGMRVQNARLGQIMIYPALPGDGGLYICEAARMVDDTGQTMFKRKTFVVEIIMGVPINKGLIIIAGGGVLAALCLVAFGIYISFRWTKNSKKEVSEPA